jgi:intein-encoded DNA endonuclease-like protein
MIQKSLFGEQEETDEKSSLGKRAKKAGVPLTEFVTRKMLEDWYLIQEKSLDEIAKILGCTKPTVHNLMKKQYIQRRKRSTARVLAIKKNKFDRFKYDDIDDDFFGQWTPKMAWVLGLLFTDGNVQRTKSALRVSITSMDYELLDNIKYLLGSTREIKKKPQSYDKSIFIYSFEFYREKMRDDLHTLGLLERKSLNMQFPEIPESCIRHFIRGCWDGDGSVFLSDGKLRASYVCGSLEFIKTLANELYKIGIYRRVLIGSADSIKTIAKLRSQYPDRAYPLKLHVDKRSKAPSYSIKIDSKEGLTKLFHYFYDGVNESMFLTRKYDVFVKGLNISEEMQKAVSNIREDYTTMPIRLKHEDLARKGKKKRNKTVLKIKNDDKRMRCKMCGDASAMLLMINQTYCPKCFKYISELDTAK